MYRKVSDGGNTFDHSGVAAKREESEPIKPPNPPQLELPVSYIMCPRCSSQKLESCNCWPINYYCPQCQWRHLNHHHNPPAPSGTPDFGGNISNNSLMDGIIRK